MTKMIRVLICILFVTFLAHKRLHAECVQGEDPCVPKKKIGEWDRSLAIGFNMTSGNSNTKLFTVLGRGYYENNKDIVDLTTMYNFGEDSAVNNEEGDSTTRNDFRALASYNRLLDDRIYLGLGTRFFYDDIADIDYRVFVDPSLGNYFIKDNSFKFRLEAGPSYVFERVGGIKSDYLAPRIGDRFEWIISCTSKIYQSADILFDVTDSNNYLVNAELGAEAALSSSMSLVFLARETYDNQPAEGRKKDDLALITALKVAI
jgi:putative salt-induced outer membrane protein YdiY